MVRFPAPTHAEHMHDLAVVDGLRIHVHGDELVGFVTQTLHAECPYMDIVLLTLDQGAEVGRIAGFVGGKLRRAHGLLLPPLPMQPGGVGLRDHRATVGHPHDAGSVQPCIGILLRRGVVILIDIGQAQRANLEAGIGQAFVAGQSQHMAAETADGAFCKYCLARDNSVTFEHL